MNYQLITLLTIIFGFIATIFTVIGLNNQLRAELKTDIKDLKADNDKRFELIDKRFELIDKKFELMDKRFDKLQDKLDAINNRIDILYFELFKKDRKDAA